MFDNLEKWSPSISPIGLKTFMNLSQPKNSPYADIGLESPSNGYADYNSISDFFQEENRLSAKKKKFDKTPIEIYSSNFESIRQEAIRRFGVADNQALREAFYQLYRKTEAETFRPSTAAALYQLFDAKSVLDFSAGWGDRLIAAMAKRIRYVGIDPNVRVFEGYRSIIEFFSSNRNINPNNYKMIQSSFEDVNLGNEEFDMILTSPPYFDFEIYNSEDPNQSINRYPDLDTWLNSFLLVSLNKAFFHLKIGGYMVINIEDVGRSKYVESMIQIFGERNFNAKYLGYLTIGKEGAKSGDIGRPFFIWRKIEF
jgi:tRNA1(Val) A37 N6-methylase TrmN6